MGLYGSLTYAPIWTGEPLRLEGWRTARFYCPVMPELDVLFPQMQLGRMAGQELTGERLAECLHEALWACTEERSKTTRPDRRYAPNLRPLAHWQTSVQFQRKNLIEQMVQFASNDFTGLASLLLQGSLADGGVVEGYSDCDVIAILRLPQSKESFLKQISSVFQINDFLLAYQPLMHHGPMIYFQEALGWATESTLPSAILANSVLLVGQAPEVEYVNGDLEAGHAIRVFERFFERNFLRAAQLETAFDALWWISCTSLVPCLEYQLQERVSVWKRDLLSTDPTLFAFVEEFVMPGASVWDIGANLGLLTFAAAHRAGPTGNVLAVEPDIDNISIMLMAFPHLFPRDTNQWKKGADRDPATDTFASPEVWTQFADFYKRAQTASKLALDASHAKHGNEFKSLMTELRAACNSCHEAFLKTE